MKNKIKFIFFVFGVLTIFFTGVYWWFVKSFGNINILQILWHIENASTLKEFDDSLIRHFIQWIGICLLGCIAWFFLLYKRSVIYIYMIK